MESSSLSLDDCLNLLRGERDEQKFAGLLLVTKLLEGDDQEALLKIYKVVGTHFLHRLLITGTDCIKGGVDKDAYLKLSVTVLAAFCRAPEVASSKEMVSEVPIIVEILSNSYLAEAPFACKEKTRDLLQYILSVEGEDESSPFYSICFLLPMLCQTTMHIDGCQALVSVGGHKSVLDWLVKLLGNDGASVDNGGAIKLACDVILNLLLSRKELGNQIEGSQFIPLMQMLCLWAENNSDPSIVMLASSICALVFDLTSEKNLLNHSEFNHSTLEGLSQLFIRSLGQGLSKDEWNSCHDLSEIVRAGYDRWSQRYPFIKNAVNLAVHLNFIEGYCFVHQ